MYKTASLINDDNLKFIEKVTIINEADMIYLIGLLNRLKANPIDIIKFVNIIKNFKNKTEVIIEKGDNGIYLTTNVKPTKKFTIKSKDDIHTYKINIINKCANFSKSIEKEFLDFNKKDEFFEFDSEKVDSSINNMHFLGERKISASEFMQEEVIDGDLIEDVKDIIEEVYNLDKDDSNCLVQCMNIVSLFIKFFNGSIEFKELAYGLEKLIDLLYNNKNLIKDNKFIIKIFNSILEDLIKFTETVIIDQSAIDVHYLDASLLANVTQLELILNKLKERN